ncbi:hypothetical protein CAEBREN_31658, partial [Caenorhabditis brenneri]
MRTCLSILLSYAMALTIGLRDYLKTTRVGKCFLSVFGYFYVRWRVMRSTSPELEGEFDSHDSSYYESQRTRQKPTCIEIYRQFMDYGSTDDTIPGHIFLSNSASYQNPSSSQKFVQNSYEFYQNMPSRSVEFVTYPEVNDDSLDKVAKWVESESFNLRTESMSSDLASTVLQEQSDSSLSSDYRTVSISSPVAKEISERFSTKYWNVESHNDDGAIGARDNYHNRYFGKAGYYLTRNAIQNHCN